MRVQNLLEKRNLIDGKFLQNDPNIEMMGQVIQLPVSIV